MDFTLSTAALGAVSAVVASLFSLLPGLGKTDLRRALVSIVALIATAAYSVQFNFTSAKDAIGQIAGIAVFALLTYKQVLQPIAVPLISAGLARVSRTYAASATRARIAGITR